VSRNQKGKTNLDLNEARDSEWQWHQLGHMQVCTLLQTDNHASTLPLSFLQTGCPSCCRTNSINALLSIKITATDFSLLPGNSVSDWKGAKSNDSVTHRFILCTSANEGKVCVSHSHSLSDGSYSAAVFFGKIISKLLVVKINATIGI